MTVIPSVPKPCPEKDIKLSYSNLGIAGNFKDMTKEFLGLSDSPIGTYYER
jgi:hypothetical protein